MHKTAAFTDVIRDNRDKERGEKSLLRSKVNKAQDFLSKENSKHLPVVVIINDDKEQIRNIGTILKVERASK